MTKEEVNDLLEKVRGYIVNLVMERVHVGALTKANYGRNIVGLFGY